MLWRPEAVCESNLAESAASNSIDLRLKCLLPCQVGHWFLSDLILLPARRARR